MSIAQSILANPGKYSLAQLKQGVEDGVIPAYIGVPIIQEMMQNQARMTAMGQEQMPPVMDQIMAQADQGVEALSSNLPQEYAGGGIIAFQNQGFVPSISTDDEKKRLEAEGEAELRRLRDAQLSPEQMTNDRVQSYVDRYKRLMPEKDPRMVAYEASLTKTPEQLEARKNQDLNMALTQLGLGLMGSKSRTVLGGISEAAQPVLPSVQAALLARRTAEDTALKNRADLARAERTEGIAALTGGVGMYEKEQERSSELAKEMAKREATIAAGHKPTDMANFVNTYVKNAKDNPDNKLSDNALAIQGYKMYFAEGPKFAAPGIGAQLAIAGGAQAVQTAGQNQTAQALAIKEFNDLKSINSPEKREFNQALKRDQANAKLGIQSNEAGPIRDAWLKNNTPSGVPIVAPSTAPRVAPPAQSALPPGSTTGKRVPGKGTEVFVGGKLVGYAN